MIMKLGKALVGSALAVAMSATFAVADTSSTKTPQVDTEPGSHGKTSDRTPGNLTPHRTPNASSAGNTGTDAGQTHEGTSDRTPR
jgi:hypothetical protein